jgi:tRNA (uracil-5-)-methyltransferase
MNCAYFGRCGSCKYDNYQVQIGQKIDKVFKLFGIDNMDIFLSNELFFRSRVEFGFRNGKYTMRDIDGKEFIVEDCMIVDKAIYNAMPHILDHINSSTILSHKLFGVEFMSNSKSELLITLIYHKNLDDNWEIEANRIPYNIIGRSKNKKIITKQDYLIEELTINQKTYQYLYQDTTFSQPNREINKKMIKYILDATSEFKGDLIELYCGVGNFTIPLSYNFDKVLATEVVRGSIKKKKKAIEMNNIDNISFARLSSEEFSKALNGEIFRRLGDINVGSFGLDTILIDPPRSGLDSLTIEIVKKFKNVIYISCDKTTLKRDIDILGLDIKKLAIFDQFPYTNHIETIAVLGRD